MTIPSEQCKAVARHALKVFGGELKVQAYYDDFRSISVDVLTTLDSLHVGGEVFRYDRVVGSSTICW